MKVIQFMALLLLFNSFSTWAVDNQTEEARIFELESIWSDMFAKKDLNGVIALLAKQSVLIMPGTAPIVGTEAIHRATKSMMASDDKVTWKSDFVQVAASGDMAYDYGTSITTLADGSTVKGSYLVVWIKEDGQWKVAADMFN
ncbi:YybH family protein [Paraglaciecola aestuariivivens]